jgi:hypothetical protein
MPRTRALTLLALTLVACKNPERDELLNWLDDYEDERASTRVGLCSCPELLGYATDEECEADEQALGSSEKTCIADVFEGNEDIGLDYYSCVTPALEQYGICLENQIGACPPDWDEPCTSEYEAALAECPTLSTSKAMAVFECSN